MPRVVREKARKFRKVNILVKEELSDFLKTAYKYGKVKDVKEWHKGKIENVLKEYKKSFYNNLKSNND